MNSHARILKLNKAGMPLSWVTREEAVTIIVKNQVVWSHGESVLPIYGGVGKSDKRSYLNIPSIIAVGGKIISEGKINLTRLEVYLRDGGRCQYCLKKLLKSKFTVDHVYPKSKYKNAHRWTNCVSV